LKFYKEIRKLNYLAMKEAKSKKQISFKENITEVVLAAKSDFPFLEKSS
jgi:hypothetical protein